MRPNPPRLVTVALAVVLLVVGLSLTIVPIGVVNEMVVAVPAAIGIAVAPTAQLGWICLVAANALLLLGSLVRGI
jgi:hypothetical protein